MAKLIVPAEDNSSKLQPMSISGIAEQADSARRIGQIEETQAAEANAQAAKIGAEQQSLGNWVAEKGNEYFARAAKAITDTLYNTINSNATKDYNKRAANRMNDASQAPNDPAERYVKTAQYGAPGSLSGAISKDAQDVIDTYSPALPDEASKQKFTQNIATLNENHKASADNVERNLHSVLAGQSIDEAINTNIQSGLTDQPENLGYYAKQGLDTISQGLQTGSISIETATKLGEKLRKGLYFGSLTLENKNNPAAVSQILMNKTAGELNISDLEYQQLKKQNQLALADQTNLNRFQYQSQNEITAAQQRFAVGSLGDKIRSGDAKAVDIQEAYDKGTITYPQFLGLQRQFTNAQNNKNSTMHLRANLSADITKGNVLSDYSPAQIDEHYQNEVRSLSNDGNIHSVTILDKASVASHYKGPIPSYSNEIKYGINSNDPKLIQSSLVAYNNTLSQNPLAVSDLTKDSKFMAYAAALTNSYKYTTQNSPEDIKKIRDSIYNADGREVRARDNAYNKETDFASDNIKKTIANMYPNGNPWYRGPDYVDDHVVGALAPLLRDAYKQTGDSETAKQTVLQQTKHLIGHTSVNDIPKWGYDLGTLMFLPPEQVYGDKIGGDPQHVSQTIRSLVNNEIRPYVPAGVDPNQVFVGSDDVTLDQAKRGQNPSYYLYYLDKNNHEVLLPKRWAYDQTSQNVMNQMNADIAQKNIPTDKRVNPTFNFSQDQQVADKHKQTVQKIMSTAKNYNQHPLMSDQFVQPAAGTLLVNQIGNHYKGEADTKQAVQGAISRMVGPDVDSWRVGQTLKFVNSVLTSNAEPKEFLKFGTVTTTPKYGDVVVTKTQAGLVGDFRNINGIVNVGLVSSDKSGNVQKNYIPVSNVLGYRSLPTPETFASQSADIVDAQTKEFVPTLDIFNQGNTRMPTGQENLDYELVPGDRKQGLIKKEPANPNDFKQNLQNTLATGNSKDAAQSEPEHAPVEAPKKKGKKSEAVVTTGTQITEPAPSPVDNSPSETANDGLADKATIDPQKDNNVVMDPKQMKVIKVPTKNGFMYYIAPSISLEGVKWTDREIIDHLKKSGKHMGGYRDQASAQAALEGLTRGR